MRPSLLDPLFAALTTLPGVGPKLDKLYRRLFGREDAPARVLDLLFHLPTGTIDRRARPKLRDVVPGSSSTVAVTVDRHRPPPPNRPRAALPDLRQRRHRRPDHSPTFTPSATISKSCCRSASGAIVSGTTALYDGMLQMVHPDRVVSEADLDKLPLVEPVYPLTEGLSSIRCARRADAALDENPAAAGMAGRRPGSTRNGFPALRRRAATRCTGRPSRPTSLPESKAWSRLAYDELLAGQLALALVRAASAQRCPAAAAPAKACLRAKVIAALPYSLTPSQARAVDDIVTDLARPQRMVRLLQGDVGSGKTVVALLAAATVIEAGRQAALMAPTEILARQHLATIAPLAEKAGLRVAILTGRERGKERDETLRTARARRDRSAGRHPRAVPGRGRVPRPRARHHRRAAPLRRAPAPRARPQGRGRRHAGADRDADPAHAGAHLFRRHGNLGAAREAGRPPADRHPHHRARPARRGGRRPSAARSTKASASTGSARWSRNPR